MVNPVYPSILALGIRSLLVNRLQKAIQSQERNQTISPSAPPSEAACRLSSEQLLPLEHSLSVVTPQIPLIPLNRVKDKTQICYVSAIALKLAGQNARKGSAMNLALEIGDNLEQMIKVSNSESPALKNHPLGQIWQNVAVQVTFPGWIYLKLTEQAVADWLQILADQRMHLSSLDQSTSRVVKNTLSNLESAFNNRDSTDKFYVSYSHARCCSLLRSAAREGIISLDPINFALKEPNLRLLPFQHPTERHLVSQIVTVLDDMAALGDATVLENGVAPEDRPMLNAIPLAARLAPDPVSIWKSAQALSHSFEDFYQACRIWGAVMQHEPQLAQMRLGLVLITQKVLRSLLEEGLAIAAPVEL